MKELKAISFFYDIGRSDFTGYSRTNAEYISNFVNFFSEFEIELLLVTTSALKIEIEEAIHKNGKIFKTKLTFLTQDFSQFIHPLENSTITHILKSSQMSFMSARSSIDVSRRNVLKSGLVKAFSKNRPQTVFDVLPVKNFAAPEYKYSEYLKLIWLKPSIVKLAFESNFVEQNDQIAFMDFGFGHSNSEFIQRITQRKLLVLDSKWDTQKLILTKRLPGSLSPNPWDYAKLIDDAFIPTGFFISSHKSAIELEKWWYAKIVSLSKGLVIVDDQTLMAIYSAEQPESIQFVETYSDQNLKGLEKWLPIVKFSEVNG